MTVYEIITDRIIKALEAGTVPWRKPWQSTEGLPQSLQSGKVYRGVNLFLLAMARYGSPYWLTVKQITERGGKIRKGEHGTPIVFWKTYDDKTEVNPKTGKPLKRFVLRYYLVWNVEQTDGINYPQPQKTEHDPIPVCEQLVTDWKEKPVIQHLGQRACYDRSTDVVTMPELGYFDSPEEYYSTLFHELGHSTGHTSRLNRDLSGTFGSGNYATEELIVEMSAAFLCGHCGIATKTIDNSAAYIAGWIKRLKDDPKIIVTAAGKAQKAADMIRGIKWENDSDNEVAQNNSDNEVTQSEAA